MRIHPIIIRFQTISSRMCLNSSCMHTRMNSLNPMAHMDKSAGCHRILQSPISRIFMCEATHPFLFAFRNVLLAFLPLPHVFTLTDQNFFLEGRSRTAYTFYVHHHISRPSIACKEFNINDKGKAHAVTSVHCMGFPTKEDFLNLSCSFSWKSRPS